MRRADNLTIVFGRTAFLDVYALAPMIWGEALYLRGRKAGVLAAAVVMFPLVAIFST